MMKRFKFLSALFVGLIGLVSFGNCFNVPNGYGKTVTVGSYQSYLSFSYADHSINYTVCLGRDTTSCNINFVHNGKTDTVTGRGLDCFSGVVFSSSTSNNPYFTNNGNSCPVYAIIFPDIYGGFCNSCPDCPTCEDQYTSEECQQEYSLMPINSCNSEYCGLNGLCPEYTGSTMSELYINGINHLGAPIINISIPLEQAWDYNYTGDVMNINLSGENNVDYEYMDNIIRTQNSKPNSTDLNNIVSVLLPKFVPGLFILLFILFIFRFIKKIF